ncbi:hypothetical protein DAEQUDRAFT_736220 [Daedalea quercina L-15889]|uniref:Uncharacterized protein n=1 Tax=Daedalea quercina L-15889 TaxID=1314783 RepID=A0A165STD4_9APHY|nr:hypothetical protein DAEQUDRAFT_736220 [Daedalea quercina L-15889]
MPKAVSQPAKLALQPKRYQPVSESCYRECPCTVCQANPDPGERLQTAAMIRHLRKDEEQKTVARFFEERERESGARDESGSAAPPRVSYSGVRMTRVGIAEITDRGIEVCNEAGQLVVQTLALSVLCNICLLNDVVTAGLSLRLHRRTTVLANRRVLV